MTPEEIEAAIKRLQEERLRTLELLRVIDTAIQSLTETKQLYEAT